MAIFVASVENINLAKTQKNRLVGDVNIVDDLTRLKIFNVKVVAVGVKNKKTKNAGKFACVLILVLI